MDPAAADRIVLVSGIGAEILAVLLLLAIGLAGLAVGLVMFRRGRVEALSLAGIFGFVVLAALVALCHLPTRLAIDREGVDLAWWLVQEHRGWNDIAAVDIRPGRLGAWVRLSERRERGSLLSLVWPPRAGCFVAALPMEPHQLAMRIEAWRLAGGR